jgi:hypothetical protein
VPPTGGSPFSQVPVIESEIKVGELSIPRAWISAVQAGNRIFLAGGGAITPYNVIDILDMQTGNMEQAVLSQGRYGIGVAATGQQVFFAGGLTTAGWSVSTNRVDIYDLSTRLMSTANLSEARSFLSAVAVGNLVIFAGGLQQGGNLPSASVDLYHTETGEWSQARLGEARYGMGVFRMGNRVYFAGGVNRTGKSSAMDVYDIQTDQWTTVSLPRAVFKNHVIETGNSVFLVEEWSKKALVLDKVSGQWSDLTIMDHERHYMAVALSGEKILVMGGMYPAWQNTNLVEVFDTRTMSRKQSYLNYDILGAAVVSAGKFIYVAGGESETLGQVLSGIYKVVL